MTWRIVKTEFRREQAVAAAIDAMGFPAWLPAETRFHASRGAKRPRRAIWQVPVLPGRLFVDVSRGATGDLDQIRGFAGLERDVAGGALSVPIREVEAFMAALDAHNAILLRSYERTQAPEVRAKPMKFTLGDVDAPTIRAMLFGSINAAPECQPIPPRRRGQQSPAPDGRPPPKA